MIISSIVNNALPVIRDKLANIVELDDKKALEEIISVVFTINDIQSISNAEIDIVIQTLFYKTRRRLGILEPLLNDSDVSEIMANGPNSIYFEKNGRVDKSIISFESIEELEEVMRNIASDVHREFNELNPIVDARLVDGSRVNLVYKNVAINGPILTIRKFSDSYITMEKLIENKTISKEGALLLMSLVESGYNIFVSGGTSSGKTTLLNALAQAIPKDERVIVIEDSMELKLSNVENIVHMECRSRNSQGIGLITMSDLIKSSLRMRPDRIVVGEVRGIEVIDMLQAMNTGHQGSLSTGHGNSVQGMLKRLETMYLMGMPISIDAIRSQIAEGIDIMVHIQKLKEGTRRVFEISEIIGYDNGEYSINPLMKYNKNDDCLETINNLKNIEKLDRFANEI